MVSVDVHAVTPILNVSDLAASIAWFETLGWSSGFRWYDDEGVLAFGAVESDGHEIFLCRDGQGSRDDPGRPGGAGTWLAIWVSDVDRVHALCIDTRIHVLQPPTDMPWHVRELHLRHPDGHVLRISQEAEHVPHHPHVH